MIICITVLPVLTHAISITGGFGEFGELISWLLIHLNTHKIMFKVLFFYLFTVLAIFVTAATCGMFAN